MSKKIKAIKINFENIEDIVIPQEFFESYDHSRSESDILRGIEEKSVEFVLRKEVIGVEKLLDYDIHMVEYENKTIFDRILNYNDICSILLIYDDNSQEKFIVEWEDEDGNEFKNKLQKAWITANGDLHVIIKRQ